MTIEEKLAKIMEAMTSEDKAVKEVVKCCCDC